uniref:Uncharacterized protein n=1 Tax=Rhizophora mucronata TaxID=61149 RepID=A0A2P2PI34_RHIMU
MTIKTFGSGINVKKREQEEALRDN